MAKKSLPLKRIMRRIRGVIQRIYIVMITDTLDYLEYSKLVSPAQAVLGTLLDIKPYLAIEEGKIVPMEKVRSRDKAIDKLTDFANEFSEVEQMVIMQSTPYPTEETKLLQERLSHLAQGEKGLPILLYGPLLASHVGPDALGLIVYEKSF